MKYVLLQYNIRKIGKKEEKMILQRRSTLDKKSWSDGSTTTIHHCYTLIFSAEKMVSSLQCESLYFWQNNNEYIINGRYILFLIIDKLALHFNTMTITVRFQAIYNIYCIHYEQ